MGSRGKSKPAEPKEYTEYNPEGEGIRGLRRTEYDDERKQRGLSDRRTILKKTGPGELVTTRQGHMKKKQFYFIDIWTFLTSDLKASGLL